ncbi:MAG: galactokinase [Anaerolineaceae bacterium]
MAYYCYLLECTNGAYYSGWAQDPIKRFKTHLKGRGARYTHLNPPNRIVYIEEILSLSAALKREAAIKKLSHSQKKAMILNTQLNIVDQFNDESFPSATKHAVEVLSPGRVNMLGEHVDYNDGIVLPAAIDRYVRLVAKRLNEPILKLKATNFDREIDIPLDRLELKVDVRGEPLPSFGMYPAGVAWALQKAGFEPTGMEISYTSDIPIGAGLSSSAAVQVGFARVWDYFGGWSIPGLELAKLCQISENQYIGVQSGLMDQFACAMGVKDHVLKFDTRSFEWSAIKLPIDTSIILADSGVRRSLTNSAYNDRRADCEMAVKLLKKQLPEINSLRDVTPAQLKANLHHLPSRISLRALHVVNEIDRVQRSLKYLESNDAVGFGKLMYASHNSLKDLYEVSNPELDLLVSVASTLKGCYGARLTGAGFGGCTVNLVDTSKVDSFCVNLKNEYQRHTQKDLTIYRCQASDGASVVRR